MIRNLRGFVAKALLFVVCGVYIPALLIALLLDEETVRIHLDALLEMRRDLKSTARKGTEKNT